MDAQQFLAEFGHIASAPGGVQRVRQLVLQLAVSGHLVQPNPKEESVEVALLEAERLRVEYESALRLRRSHHQPALREAEHPYAIPVHWRWQRLEQIACYIQRGKGPSYAHTGSTFVVSQKCIRWKGFDLSSARPVDEASLKNYGDERFLYNGDLLWNSTGTGTVGRVAIFNEKETVRAVADSHVTVIRMSNFVPRYVWCVIASPWVQARIAPEHEDAIVSGTTKQVELATSSVRALAIPCPPIGEQKRIVAKVDELIALCNKLEARQQKSEALCKLTRTAILEALGSTNTNVHLGQAWARLAGNMRVLLDSPESVEDFRHTIMRLAVWGGLTKRTEANSRELLERCLIHREKLLKEGQIKRGRLKKRSEDQPARLPENWTWARFSEIGIFARGKSKNRPRNDPRLFLGGHYPFVQTGDVAKSVGKGISTFSKSYNEVGLKQSRLWPRGTLCITIAANIAESAILKIDACFPDSIVGFLPFEMVGNVEYFDLFVRTAKQELTRYAPSTAQKNINLGILEQVAVPLPPRREMEDIVKTTGKLLDLCARIEQKLAESQDVGKWLSASTVSAMTGIRIEDKEKMKAPKTELVSNLRIGGTPTSREQAPLSAILIRHQGELSAKALWSSSGLEIDTFYQQLKTEMANGWITQPETAYMKEVETA